MIHVAAAALLAAVAPSPGAAAPANIGLSAVPARLTLVGTAQTTITVRNPGSRRLVVAASRARFGLSARGKPRVVSGRTGPDWLTVRPRRLLVGPGRAAKLTVSAARPAQEQPGDHPALVLLTTRPLAGARVRVRLRIGVVVVLHVPGRIVRRLRPLRLTVHRLGRERLLELRLANRGNVTEALDGGRLRLVLVRRGRVVATVRLVPRELLPHSVGIAEFVYRGRLRGAVGARVEVRLRPRGRLLGRRVFRLRL